MCYIWGQDLALMEAEIFFMWRGGLAGGGTWCLVKSQRTSWSGLPPTRRWAGVGFGKRCHEGSDNSDGDGKSFHNRFYKLLECPLSPKLGRGLRLWQEHTMLITQNSKLKFTQESASNLKSYFFFKLKCLPIIEFAFWKWKLKHVFASNRFIIA